MIIKQHADDIIKASHQVTTKLLRFCKPDKPVVIKPNIVEPTPPPVTTDVRVVEGILHALRDAKIHEVCIAEGSGTGDTLSNFRLLGYEKIGAQLIDLDDEKTITVPVKDFFVWEQITIPQILLDTFIISVPVLKEHSLCGVTISLKNMVGVLPAKYYSGYWAYKKSQIHKYDSDGCIADLINVIRPDCAIIDATIGMKGSHLSGTPIHPPLNFVYGSINPLKADIFGCNLLRRNWRSIRYLTLIEKMMKGQAARTH